MVEAIQIKSRYDGLEISTLIVRPEGRPKAVLQISHGMCGSKERYMPFMEFMSMNGIACIANDHRGHGESILYDDDLGYMYEGGAEALVDDMMLVSEYVCEMFPDSPLFLLGHSMGSLAARACIRRDDSRYCGLVLCGSPSTSSLVPVIGRTLSFLCRCGLGHFRPRIVPAMVSDWYNRHFLQEGHQSWTCSDPAVRNSFRSNPKNNFRFTLNGSKCLMELMQAAYDSDEWSLNSPFMPVTFLSGEDDPVTGGRSGMMKAVDTMRKAGYRYISMKTYQAMRHEILNETGRDQVWHDILDFIVQEV